VYVDGLKSGRYERVLVSTARVDIGPVRSSRDGRDVLDGVLSDVVLGRSQSHHWTITRARHGRLTMLAVRVLELLRCIHATQRHSSQLTTQS